MGRAGYQRVRGLRKRPRTSSSQRTFVYSSLSQVSRFTDVVVVWGLLNSFILFYVDQSTIRVHAEKLLLALNDVHVASFVTAFISSIGGNCS